MREIKFDHRTHTIMHKHDYDRKTFQDPRRKWLKETFGRPALTADEGDDVRWDIGFDYVDNGTKIKETFSFRDEKDLTLFLLRYS